MAASVWTCPRCGRSFALAGLSGLLCPCAGSTTPISSSAGAPSPASTAMEVRPIALPRATDGGSGTSERAAGSPGRGAEKAPQRSPGAPREAISVDPAIQAAPIATEDHASVKGFKSQRFYKKGGIDNDVFGMLAGVSKAYGYAREKDGEWRGWFKGLVESNDKGALDKAAKILAQAGIIKLKTPVVAANDVRLKDDMRASLMWIKAHPDKTLSDLQAAVPQATQEIVDALLNGGFIYEAFADTYRSMEEGK